MNLLEIAKQKREQIPRIEDNIGFDSVINHIETAEQHFSNAKIHGDYLYTDAIYRSNQAFEGALKEAYRILAEKNPDKQTPLRIEEYFEQESVLKQRVLQLFTNYRKEWRNPSTHDYKLSFSSQEAILAISSVTAFFCILQDQIIEKITFDDQKKRAEEMRLFKNKKIDLSKNLALQISGLICDFINSSDEFTSSKSESEVLGRLSGFLSSLNILAKDQHFGGNTDTGRDIHPDLLINVEGIYIPVEIKRAGTEISRRRREALLQVEHCAKSLDAHSAIALVLSIKEQMKYSVVEHISTTTEDYRAYSISPMI